MSGKEELPVRVVSPLSLEVFERSGSSPMREAGKGIWVSRGFVVRSAVSMLNQSSRELGKIQIPRTLPPS